MFDLLVGMGLTQIEGLMEGRLQCTFHTLCGRKLTLVHERECCEVVNIQRVLGDPSCLIGLPILRAEKITRVNDESTDDRTGDLEGWTLYTIGTSKGTVDICFYGKTNGYLSVGVSEVWSPDKAGQVAPAVNAGIDFASNPDTSVRVHELDCWPDAFDAVQLGVKTAEVRRDDRGFRVGDFVKLLRLQHNARGAAVDPDAEPIYLMITHYLPGGQFGIMPGYCLLSFERAETAAEIEKGA